LQVVKLIFTPRAFAQRTSSLAELFSPEYLGSNSLNPIRPSSFSFEGRPFGLPVRLGEPIGMQAPFLTVINFSFEQYSMISSLKSGLENRKSTNSSGVDSGARMHAFQIAALMPVKFMDSTLSLGGLKVNSHLLYGLLDWVKRVGENLREPQIVSTKICVSRCQRPGENWFLVFEVFR
jgi:hypothetical protein